MMENEVELDAYEYTGTISIREKTEERVKKLGSLKITRDIQSILEEYDEDDRSDYPHNALASIYL